MRACESSKLFTVQGQVSELSVFLPTVGVVTRQQLLERMNGERDRDGEVSTQ